MRVAHVLAPAAFGGLESVVLSLTHGLASRGVESLVVPVVEESPSEHLFVGALRAKGIPVAPIVVGARDYPGEARRVGALLRSQSIGVLHTHGFRSDVVHRFAHRGLSLHRISTAHGFVDNTWRERAYNRLQIGALAHLDRVIAVSASVRSRLVTGGVARDRIRLIPNAVTPPALKSRAEALLTLGIPDDDKTVLGWVGRLSHEKGPDVMVEALERFRDVHGAETLPRIVFVGDGPLREGLIERVRREGLSDRVSFPGLIAGASKILSAFDGVVLSSRTEGTPMVALEAMTCGIPVVGTMVGGLPALVRTETGYPVPSEDPGALAAAIHQLLENREAGRARGRAGQELVAQEFSLSRWLDLHEEVYRGG